MSVCKCALLPSSSLPPLPTPTAFTELEMMKLWKGLYVCMWHSDKPLVQVRAATPCRCVCVSVGRGGGGPGVALHLLSPLPPGGTGREYCIVCALSAEQRNW